MGRRRGALRLKFDLVAASVRDRVKLGWWPGSECGNGFTPRENLTHSKVAG